MLSERRFRFKARRWLAIALAASVSGVAAQAASAYVDFSTPGYAAWCFVAAGEVNYTPNPALICVTPNDGFTVTMTPAGRPTKRYDRASKWSYPYALKRLRWGQDWWASDSGDNTYTGTGQPSRAVGTVLYVCKSRSSGLTCTNRNSHGWSLGRFRGYRLF